MAGYEERILEGVNQILVPNSDRTYDEVLDQDDEQFEQDWQDWYENRKHWLNTPYGWLSLRSIDWLKDGETIRIKDFPGSWTQHGDSVVYTPDEGEVVTNRGEVITEPKTITVDTVADVNVEDFEHEGVRAQLIKRIGSDRQFAVRVRDPQSKTRSSFQEIPHYQPDKKWVFPARYVPSEQ